MKDAYLYKFRDDGRIYQIIFSVDRQGGPKIIDSKRLSPWIGSGPTDLDKFEKIESRQGLSELEVKKLADEGFSL